jgi:hypothetical protein
VLEREWTGGDVVSLKFDFSPRVWVGERESLGKISIYRGPVLLAYDPRFDKFETSRLPSIDPSALALLPTPTAAYPSPMLLVEVPARDGRTVRLCDFATAGMGGNKYSSWVPGPMGKPTRFDRSNPLRLSP